MRAAGDARNRYACRHVLRMAAGILLTGTVSVRAPSSGARQLGPGLRVLRAPNPGPMTGSGTNTYLLGEREVVVIDPGPAIARHIDAILDVADGSIAWILATHTHLDHSPAARELAARGGARIAGAAPPDCGRQDSSFAPELVLADDDVIETFDVALRAVHTPGHASNHLCYWRPETRSLFTGDHVIDGSTVVIDPPDGNMTHYMASLRKLKTFDAATLLPGHGSPLRDPTAAIDALIEHRERREASVLNAVRPARAYTIDELLAPVYDDVETDLHRIAERSLLAHLLKLEADGRILRDGNCWRRR